MNQYLDDFSYPWCFPSIGPRYSSSSMVSIGVAGQVLLAVEFLPDLGSGCLVNIYLRQHGALVRIVGALLAGRE